MLRSVATSPDPRAQVGQLYLDLAPRLREIVGAHGGFPPAVVDDACQAAWALLLARPDAVEASCRLSWLSTTARREAIEIQRRLNRHVELDAVVGAPAPHTVDGGAPERVHEVREELARLGALSRRQRELVWLRALGYAYAEIAERTGENERVIERQLLHARRRLRAAGS